MRRKIDALAAQIAQAEASAGRATSMAQAVDDLAGKLAVIAPRTQIVEDLEGRLNALHALSADVDRRLSDQLARRTELDNLKVLCDGVAAQLVDAQQKLAALGSAQAELEPAMNQISTLQSELESAREGLRALQQDEDELARAGATVRGSGGVLTRCWRSTSHSVWRRCRASRPSWARPAAIKEELLGELARVQSQRARHLRSARGGGGPVQTARRALEDSSTQRRAQLEETEQTMARVDARMEELRHLSDDVDRKIQAVADREQVVEAVKRGVEEIHALGLKSQAELAAIAERRAEIAQATSRAGSPARQSRRYAGKDRRH